MLTARIFSMSLFKKILFFFLLSYAGSASADSSKEIEVDLDTGSTVIVKAPTDASHWTYFVDKTACICWVANTYGNNAAPPATVPCEKLKAHAKLKPHLSSCN